MDTSHGLLTTTVRRCDESAQLVSLAGQPVIVLAAVREAPQHPRLLARGRLPSKVAVLACHAEVERRAARQAGRAELGREDADVLEGPQLAVREEVPGERGGTR